MRIVLLVLLLTTAQFSRSSSSLRLDLHFSKFYSAVRLAAHTSGTRKYPGAFFDHSIGNRIQFPTTFVGKHYPMQRMQSDSLRDSTVATAETRVDSFSFRARIENLICFHPLIRHPARSDQNVLRIVQGRKASGLYFKNFI